MGRGVGHVGECDAARARLAKLAPKHNNGQPASRTIVDVSAILSFGGTVDIGEAFGGGRRGVSRHVGQRPLLSRSWPAQEPSRAGTEQQAAPCHLQPQQQSTRQTRLKTVNPRGSLLGTASTVLPMPAPRSTKRERLITSFSVSV